MRSRYSAYVLGMGDYLVATATAPADAAELAAWGRSVAWVGLEVVSTHGGQVAAVEGTVHFRARFIEAGALVCLEEHAAFSRSTGVWVYQSGVANTARTKLVRNDPCPCGSGKKTKHCHL